MLGSTLDRIARVVTEHDRVVVVVMLLVTAGVGVGAADLNTDGGGGGDAFDDTTVAQKSAYIQEHYGRDGGATDDGPELNESQRRKLRRTGRVTVYVRDPGGNALSKAALLRSLRFQRTLRQDPVVGDLLSGRGEIRGIATLVSGRAAGNPDADLATRIAALEDASPARVRSLVEATLSAEPRTDRYLPETHDPGAASAESRRMVVVLAVPTNASVGAANRKLVAGSRVVHERADAVDDPDHFALGRHAETTTTQSEYLGETFELVVPVALALILGILVFAYRDPTDVALAFVGVVVSLVWTFGVLGWLDVPATASMVVAPVLVVGLSVDYGLHAFMRYRERRDGETGVRAAMAGSLSRVGTAFVLVTATTAVGFLANLTTEFSTVRDLAVGITLGVVSVLVVFVTLVPALKVTVDRTLERFGRDRRRRPLGGGRLVGGFLTGGVAAARRGAPVVVALALVAGLAGGAAWGALDRQGPQERPEDVADWKTDLPGPVAWDEPDDVDHATYVANAYRSSRESRPSRSQVLVEGPVAAPGTLDRIRAVHDQLAGSDEVIRRDGRPAVRSPLTLLERLAAEHEAVAAVVERTDADGDGVPDRDLAAVYDAMYRVAPDRTARVVERRPDGSYASVRLLVLVDGTVSNNRQAAVMESAAATASGDELAATAVGPGTLEKAASVRTARSIFETLAVALVAVFAMLVVVYRLAEGTASLGAVTAVPVALVTAFLVGAMYLLGIPLTLVTALLVSLVVGLGIDYSIHVSDRFVGELDDGAGPIPALDRSVRGTGGALLGSTLTSVGAFVTLLLHPDPRMQNFGTLVVLALSLSFLVSVFVLPSLLLLWHRHVRRRIGEAGEGDDAGGSGSGSADGTTGSVDGTAGRDP